MESVSVNGSIDGILFDNPLYVSGLSQNGVETYQLPTSSKEREDRDREDNQKRQLKMQQELGVCEEAMMSQMQALAVAPQVADQSNHSSIPRPLLARPPPERVVFNQPGGQCPFAFALQQADGAEGTDWEQETIYEEPCSTTLREQYVGPSHNPAEINAFFQLRAGELVGLADPQTLDALPEQDLFALISAAMMSLRRRRSVFW